MYLGIDLGTSGVKVILMNADGTLAGSATSALTVERPQPLFSEQDPAQWWQAFSIAMDELKAKFDLSKIAAIGLSGQMHGAVLLGESDDVLHPAILWNDGRSQAQCEELEALVENSREITGNIMMPGFTAPKLKWLAQHKADVFAKVKKVLLPKDYLRLLLTGVYASDMSDSAGTLWLNTSSRTWDESLLKACGLGLTHMPTLFEGSEVTGYVLAELTQKWGLNTTVPVIAGGGDNAAGAVGVGLINAGQGMLSLGTSGVYFVVSDAYSAQADKAVHSFCHALPNKWHLMSVMLSAASCLEWFASTIVEQDLSQLMADLSDYEVPSDSPYFLPYLSGERTPHNNPHAKGAFFGLTHSTSKLTMLHAVLEGVSFAFADGMDALHSSGTKASDISLIGGGTKSEYWRQMLADVLNVKLDYREGGDVGPALGAARLAQIAIEKGRSYEDICTQPRLVKTYLPKQSKHAYFNERRKIFQKLYTATKSLM